MMSQEDFVASLGSEQRQFFNEYSKAASDCFELAVGNAREERRRFDELVQRYSALCLAKDELSGFGTVLNLPFGLKIVRKRKETK